MLKTKNVKVVDVWDWDKLVSETYGKIYSFQQQDGCQDRGTVQLTIPYKSYEESMNDRIPEVINHESERGVKFEVWLKRDINEPLNPTKEELEKCNYWHGVNDDEKEWKEDKSHIRLFWTRNFYPNLQTIANDLYEKGLVEAGDYYIDIDW